MTTLLISEIFPPANGGSGRWFWEIYRRLPRTDFAIAAGEHPLQAEFDRTHQLRVTRVPLSLRDPGIFSPASLWAYVKAFRAIRRIVRSERIERIHCGRCVPEGWLAWLLKHRYGLPYICYAHGEEIKLAEPRTRDGVMSSRQIRWMTRRVLAGADVVIANSRNTERILREEWHRPADRVKVMYPGVDTEWFRPSTRDSVVRRRLGWDDRPVILTVGRLQKRKGHDQVIQALRTIRESIPNIMYAIVGDGEERANLQQFVLQEGMTAHVRFHGELNDMGLLECYQQCDLFVLANRQVGSDIEGFGMVLQEAQACGKPVIAGASGGTVETMRIPQTGHVIACDQPHKLADLITQLLSDRATLQKMGRSARDWIVDTFDWNSLIDSIESKIPEFEGKNEHAHAVHVNSIPLPDPNALNTH